MWSVDEKSQIQAKSRVAPTKAAVPGAPVRVDHGYRRHGTAVLFAGLDVHDGAVARWVTHSTRSDNFVAFLAELIDQTPGLDPCWFRAATSGWPTARAATEPTVAVDGARR